MSATENRQQELLIHPMCSFSLYVKQTNKQTNKTKQNKTKTHESLGTELTSFFHFGKLLKITADQHASQSAIAFRPTIHHPRWLLIENNVLWNLEASAQFGCLSSFFCLCTPFHRSGCCVWVIGEDRTNLLTLES